MKKLLIVTLTAVSILTLSGCKKKDVKNEIQRIKSCPNCVYSYYKDMKKIGDDGSILTDYETDYTKVTYNDGTQRKVFLGYDFDGYGNIEKSYVCGILNKKTFCIQGTKRENANEEIYIANKKILSDIYKTKCEETQDETTNFFTCTDNITTYITNQGFVEIADSDKNICYIADNDIKCQLASERKYTPSTN